MRIKETQKINTVYHRSQINEMIHHRFHPSSFLSFIIFVHHHFYPPSFLFTVIFIYHYFYPTILFIHHHFYPSSFLSIILFIILSIHYYFYPPCSYSSSSSTIIHHYPYPPSFLFITVSIHHLFHPPSPSQSNKILEASDDAKVQSYHRHDDVTSSSAIFLPRLLFPPLHRLFLEKGREEKNG